MSKEQITTQDLAEALLSGVFRLAREAEDPVRSVVDWSEEGASLILMELVFFGIFFLAFHLVATPLIPDTLATQVVERMFRWLMESLEPQSPEEISLVREHLQEGVVAYQEHLKQWLEGEEGQLGEVFLGRLGLKGEPEVVEKVEMILVALADALREWLSNILERFEVVQG